LRPSTHRLLAEGRAVVDDACGVLLRATCPTPPQDCSRRHSHCIGQGPCIVCVRPVRPRLSPTTHPRLSLALQAHVDDLWYRLYKLAQEEFKPKKRDTKKMKRATCMQDRTVDIDYVKNSAFVCHWNSVVCHCAVCTGGRGGNDPWMDRCKRGEWEGVWCERERRR
jgi:hypothetical protein